MHSVSRRAEEWAALLLKQAGNTRRILYALGYAAVSVRELKRRYVYRTEGWHATVPEGKLFGAVRDYEDALRIQATLSRRGFGS